MKSLFLFLLLLTSFSISAQEEFKITGNLGGTLGGKLILVGAGQQGNVSLGETMMENGTFQFVGKVDGIMPAYILTERQQPIATLMLENVEYVIVAGESGIEIRGGGAAQAILSQYDAINQIILRERMKMEQEMKAAYASQNQMKLQVLQQQFSKVMEEAEKQQMALFTAHKDSPVTAFVIASGMEQLEYVTLKPLYDGLGETAKNSPYGRAIARQLEVFKQVEVGSVAPDFQGATPEGGTVSLYGVTSELKLVDFWASWCGPCRAEMPSMVKLYKKYHEKGLEIIGVSLDEKKEDWLKASQNDKITWQNISDLQGWRSPIATRYLVRAIPQTFLLDGDNRIIAKGLRGKDLEKKIAEILGE